MSLNGLLLLFLSLAPSQVGMCLSKHVSPGCWHRAADDQIPMIFSVTHSLTSSHLPPTFLSPLSPTGTLVGVGDVISQQVLERRGLANHNVTRTAKMMSIGFFFVVSPPSSCFLSFISLSHLK